MAITNKPNDGEPIVLKVSNSIVGEHYIPTPVFWRYLDELESQINSGEIGGDGFDALNLNVGARLAEVEKSLSQDLFTVDTTGFTADSTNITIDRVSLNG